MSQLEGRDSGPRGERRCRTAEGAEGPKSLSKFRPCKLVMSRQLGPAFVLRDSRVRKEDLGKQLR